MVHSLVGQYYSETLKTISINTDLNIRRIFVYKMNLCTESRPSESSSTNGSSNLEEKPYEAFCHSNDTDGSSSVTHVQVNRKQTNGPSKDEILPANKNNSKSASVRPRRPSKQLYTPPAAKAASPSPEPDQKSHCRQLNAISSSAIRTITPKNTSNSSSTKSANNLSEVQNISEKVSSDLDEDASWDTLYDDSGDLVKCDLAKSLQTSLKLDDETTHKLTFGRPISDFTDYTSSSSVNNAVNCDHHLDHEIYPNVLEVYQFSAEFKTRDLFTRISASG